MLTSYCKRAWEFARWFPRNSANGFRFGVAYFRGSRFRAPSSVRLRGTNAPLIFPDEAGVSSDFVECFIHNIYGLGQDLEKVERILDIGANVGFFSLAARGYYPEATIHAYEPNPRIQPMLRANAAKFKIEVFSEAVGGAAGKVSLTDESVSNMARTGPSQDADGNITQIRLDSALERIGGDVDLLKMDCEGAEWEMFRLANCWKSIRNIRMEYHLFNGESVKQVVGALTDLGFKVTRLDANRSDMGLIWGRRG